MSEDLNKEQTKKQTIFTTQKRKRACIKKKPAAKANKLNITKSRDPEEDAIQSQQNEQEKTNIRNQSLDRITAISANNLRADSNLIEIQNKSESVNLKRNADIFTRTIEAIRSEDLHEISEVLCELSEELSIAHESIAENSNCTNLIKELLKLLDKLQIPEIQIQILTSITYMLDIHPYFSNTIIKNEGIKSIVKLTQNVEYIDLAEIAIKAIEKISQENVASLIENSAFDSILLFVDFFDCNTKKYVVQSCLNMTKNIRHVSVFRKYIQPGLAQLTTLTKYTGNTEIEKQILNQSILCFYNIFYSINNNNLFLEDSNIWESVIQFGILDNLIEILEYFLKMINGNGVSNRSASTRDISKINIGNFMDVFKSIIKVLQYLSENTVTISNILLKKNIMQLLYHFLREELDFTTEERNKSAISNHLIFNELFPFLFSFFPHKFQRNNLDDEDKNQARLIIDDKSEVYKYFSKNIIPLIVNNFINITSSQISIKVLKLLTTFSYFSSGDNLNIYLDSWKIANIIAKMLDSNDVHYILEVFDILDELLRKIPEGFLIQLLREGVSDYVKYLTRIHADDLYINMDCQINNNYFKDIIAKNCTLIKKEESEIKNCEIQDQVKDSNRIGNSDGMIVEESNATSRLPNLEKSQMEAHENLDEDSEEEENSKPSNYSGINPNSNVLLDKKTTEIYLLYITRQKAKDLSQKYFNKEFVDKILLKLNILKNINDNPYTILENLIHISNKIKNYSCKLFEYELIKEFFDAVLVRNNLTFYEIEKSEIIKNFVNYIEDNFSIARIKNKSSVSSTNFDNNIIHKLQIIFSSLNHDISKVSKFVSLLQQCISSMNSFTVSIYEYSNYKNTSHLFQSAYKSQIQKYKINFLYFEDEETLNEYGIDSTYKELHNFYLEKSSNRSIEVDQNEIFQNLKEAILKKIYKGIVFSENVTDQSGVSNSRLEDNKKLNDIIATMSKRKGSEDYENTEAILAQLLERKQSTLSNFEDTENDNSNMLPLNLRQGFSSDLSTGRNRYDVNFYVEVKQGETLYINNKWSFNDFIKLIKENYQRQIVNDYLRNIIINFKIIVKEFNSSKIFESDLHRRMSMQVGESIQDIIKRNSDQNYVEEIIFKKHYIEKIVDNDALYTIERVSPYLFLLSLFELSINSFNNLFNLCGKLKENSLVNSKISSLLMKQVRDPYAISSNTIPQWCKEFSYNFCFLSSFNSRHLYFKTCTFDLRRSMMNLFVYIKNFIGDFNTDDSTQSTFKRKKIAIDRDDILKSTEKVLKENGNYTGLLEFEFLNETGSGIGPTLEFYSLFAKELSQNRSIWYKNSECTLFPAPYLSKLIGYESNERIFLLLGFVIARGLFDDRLLDMPLNPLFWDILLERPVSFDKLSKLDKDIGKITIEFLELIEIKKQILISRMKDDREDPSVIQRVLNENLLYKNTKLEDLCVNFTIPGYETEMVENGHNTTLSANNIELYVNLLLTGLCYDGIQDSIDAFKKGFNIVFPYTCLNCFSSEELSEYICGNSKEQWDYETLYEYIVPNHGYDKSSLTFLNFLNFLLKLDNNLRKKFLLFLTGSPRLPLGGFKNLNPKLTVVKRYPNILNENPDKYLPTVMTCQNYLKIPDYSTSEILSQRFLLAMIEGGNSFDLS